MEAVKPSSYGRQITGHHAGTQKEALCLLCSIKAEALGHEDTSKLACTVQHGTENISSMLP